MSYGQLNQEMSLHDTHKLFLLHLLIFFSSNFIFLLYG
ncbi:hypothetical protein BTN49_2126 [Candidatus Enterovibrio escicola]|uniref:Uncharacterized protein n=1 Tax=Candidatus Enterovibrio escicola TaxID=1927127 RepID=A0A2A5T2K7_9GAMM|nr:hypothetical protein BTN49_2126 [Candidatus Enterovibrio escacola]